MNRKEFPQGEIAEFRAWFTLKAYLTIDSHKWIYAQIHLAHWEASYVIAFPYLPHL